MRFIFRFKKGDRVEVLSKSQVPSGSWLCGTLISGNGHTYLIQFESPNGTRSAGDARRVPRKAIRPCPPVKVKERWAAGDLVEVYDQSSWKFAKVLKASGADIFLVGLLGTSHKVEAHKSCFRIPQSWCDGEWSVIQKVSDDIENSYSEYQLDTSYQESVANIVKERNVRDSSTLAHHDADLQVSHVVFPRTLKRHTTHNLPVKKFRAAEKEGRPQRVAPENIMQPPLKYRARSPDISERGKEHGDANIVKERDVRDSSTFADHDADLQVSHVVFRRTLKRHNTRNIPVEKFGAAEKEGRPQRMAPENIMQPPLKYRARSPDISERGKEHDDANIVKEKDVRDSGTLADHHANLQVSHVVFPRALKRHTTRNIPVAKFRAAEKEGKPQCMAPENIMQPPLKYRARSPDISERGKEHGDFNIVKERDVSDSSTLADHHANLQVSHVVFPRTLKRQATHNIPVEKFRAAEKEGRPQCMAPENIMQPPLKYRTNSPDISERGKEHDDAIFAWEIHNDGKNAGRKPCRGARKLGDGIYKMAWDAYQTTMESLGTIGYMSWEQEEKLTDLRVMLNISNEQHLQELKKYYTPLLLSCYIIVMF